MSAGPHYHDICLAEVHQNTDFPDQHNYQKIHHHSHHYVQTAQLFHLFQFDIDFQSDQI